jgi:hypothetical protein
MKTIVAALALAFTVISTAEAQCYGDAATFGCGVARSSEDSLERFGDNKNKVIPVYGDARSYSDSAFSERETLEFYRRAVRPRWQSMQNYSWSQRAYIDTINASGTPVRRFGNLPWAQPRF